MAVRSERFVVGEVYTTRVEENGLDDILEVFLTEYTGPTLQRAQFIDNLEVDEYEFHSDVSPRYDHLTQIMAYLTPQAAIKARLLDLF